MQNPVGAVFNPRSMRMELSSFYDVLFNPVAQAKFVHTVSAGYVTGAVFVMAISAWFLLKGRNSEFAKRSMTVAASFGLASALSVVVLGDESGYTASQNQKMKLAAIEAMWETRAGAGELHRSSASPTSPRARPATRSRMPWVLGLIATRSFDQQVPGIVPLVAANEDRIRSGMLAYGALEQVRAHPDDAGAQATLDAHVKDLGYGLLLKRYTGQGHRRDARANREGGLGHGAERAGAVLVVPFHGRDRLLLHRVLRLCLLAFGETSARSSCMVPPSLAC